MLFGSLGRPWRRPVIVLALFLGMGLLGGLAPQKPQNGAGQSPAIARIEWPLAGSSPVQIKRQIIIPLEKRIAALGNVSHFTARAGNGRALLELELKPGANIGQMLAGIRKIMQAAPRLPGHGRLSLIAGGSASPSMPVMSLALWSHEAGAAALSNAAHALRRHLLAIKGVAKVRIIGGRGAQLVIETMPERLAVMGVPMPQLAAAISQSLAWPQGKARLEELDDGRLRLVLGAYSYTPLQLASLRLDQYLGRPLRLGDLARVSMEPVPQKGFMRYYTGPAAAYNGLRESSGAEALAIAIERRPGADGAELEKRLARALADFRAGHVLADNMELAVMRIWNGWGEARQGHGFDLALSLPAATGPEQARNILSKLAAPLLDIYEIAAIEIYSGITPPFGHASGSLGEARAEIHFQLLKGEYYQRGPRQIAAEISRRLAPLARKLGIGFYFKGKQFAGLGLSRAVLEIEGARDGKGRALAAAIRALAEKNSAMARLASQPVGKAWRFVPRPQALRRLGLGVDRLSGDLALALGENLLGRLDLAWRRTSVPAILRTAIEVRPDIERLGNLPIRLPDGRLVALGELGSFRHMPALPAILRRDGHEITRLEIFSAQAGQKGAQAMDALVRKLAVKFGNEGPGKEKAIKLRIRLNGSKWQDLRSLTAPLAAKRQESGHGLGLAGFVAEILALAVMAMLMPWLAVMIVRWGRVMARWLGELLIAEEPGDVEAPADRQKQSRVGGPIPAPHQAADLFRRALNEDHDPVSPPPAGDLRLLRGVGPVVERIFHQQGIFSLEQIASLPVEEELRLEHILAARNLALGSGFRRYRWRDQAARLIRPDNGKRGCRDGKAGHDLSLAG